MAEKNGKDLAVLCTYMLTLEKEGNRFWMVVLS